MKHSEYTENETLSFNEKTLLADVILSDFQLIPVIGRFNIEYGFGSKTVGEVCKKYDINLAFFLEIINSYHTSTFFPREELGNFSAKLIVKYLSNSHEYYRDVKLPEIQGYIDQMQEHLSETSQFNLRLLSDFFKNYKNELEKHLLKEESFVFPYALVLEEGLISGNVDEDLHQKITQSSIANYEHNHKEMEVTLSDLKNLIIRHLPPLVCCDLCQRLLMELFRLEEDLEKHSILEEKVLVPMIANFEQQILKTSE